MMKTYSELYHHGIIGQRWGVRRFQNRDGSLTAAGKKRYITTEKVKDSKELFDVYKKLSKQDKAYAFGSRDNKANNKAINIHAQFMDYGMGHAFVTRYKNKPVSIFYISQESSDTASATVMTRKGRKYRHKGMASEAVKAGMNWMKDNDYYELYWDVNTKNTSSIGMAKKFGLAKVDGESKDNYGDTWNTYVKRFKNSKDREIYR